MSSTVDYTFLLLDFQILGSCMTVEVAQAACIFFNPARMQDEFVLH